MSRLCWVYPGKAEMRTGEVSHSAIHLGSHHETPECPTCQEILEPQSPHVWSVLSVCVPAENLSLTLCCLPEEVWALTMLCRLCILCPVSFCRLVAHDSLTLCASYEPAIPNYLGSSEQLHEVGPPRYYICLWLAPLLLSEYPVPLHVTHPLSVMGRMVMFLFLGDGLWEEVTFHFSPEAFKSSCMTFWLFPENRKHILDVGGVRMKPSGSPVGTWRRDALENCLTHIWIYVDEKYIFFMKSLKSRARHSWLTQ